MTWRVPATPQARPTCVDSPLSMMTLTDRRHNARHIDTVPGGQSPEEIIMLTKLIVVLAGGILTTSLLPSAALAHPGCSATVYWDANFGGESRTLHHDVAFVGQHWNDQISSIVVHSGRWVFYWDAGFSGETLTATPGAYAFVGNHWNDQISSARCISAW